MPNSFADGTGPRYGHGPRNAGAQGAPGNHSSTRNTPSYVDGQGASTYPATNPGRRPSEPTPRSQDDRYRPQLTSLGQAIAKLKIGDYNSLFLFVSQNPRVVAQSEINSLLTEAEIVQRAGREALVQAYVFYAVVLQKCIRYRPEELKSLFQQFASGRDAAKDLVSDVKKACDALKSKVNASAAQTKDRVAQKPIPAASAQSRADHAGPRIIQEPGKSETIPRPGMDRVNSLHGQPQLLRKKTQDGRLIYIDDQGREVRPAGGRPEIHRGCHDSEYGPPTGKMANMTFNDSIDALDREISTQGKGRGLASENLRPDQAMDRRMGPPGSGNQRRRKYTIEGTEGDTESLDGSKLVLV